MSIPVIQGQLLEVTVVGCNKLKNTEFLSKQDPYVCVEYGGTKFRTRTCTDGGKNPTFQEKFSVTLIEGLRDISVAVWNSNTITSDDFIGNGKIQLQKVLCEGYDDCPWTLQDKRGKYSGEVRLIMHYANAKASANSNSNTNTNTIKPGKIPAPSAPPAPQYMSTPLPPQYAGTPPPQVPLYSAAPSAAPYPPTNYPPPPPQPLYPSFAPHAGHPPAPYHQPAAYHPHYPPTSSYPPQTAYPPPPQVDPYRYPPGPFAPHAYPPPY